MVGLPHSPGLPETGAVLAAVNDAARRKRWPSAIIDTGGEFRRCRSATLIRAGTVACN